MAPLTHPFSIPLALTGFLLAPAPATTQTLTERYAPLALTAPTPERSGTAREFRGATVHPDPLGPVGGDPLRADAREPLPDGQPLRAQQVPRFLRPTHDGSFGFNDFLVLGDHPTVTFERWDRDDDEYIVRWRRETWRRADTRDVAGRLVSVFHPRWSASHLRRKLRWSRWGADEPSIFWGRLHLPGTDGETRRVSLSVIPPNIPPSPVVRINDRVQYASHVVNLRDPDFGVGGERTLNQYEIVRRFYDHFADEYEVVAIVSDDHLLSWWGGAHDNIRNDIRGIGMRLFDRSADLGSAGVLQAVETWDGGHGWQGWSGVLHEQGHQYGDFSKVWDSLRPPLVRAGHNPDGHTPLLYPGAVAYGAVLYGSRRVARIRSAGQPDRFEIEPTLPLVTYHPLTLYRMGLVPASAVPDMLVFHDQGQFNPTSPATPEPGTAVTGGTTTVTVDDLLAADGVRRGPAARQIRRAMVYVSRERLVPKEQMDVLNYFARRLGASSGVTTWDRYPSFAEATGGRAEMTTDIRPRRRQAAAASPAEVGCAKVGTSALVGVRLDREVGGCLRTGDTLRVSGSLTLSDRPDYDTVCIRFRRYPDADERDRIFECAPLDGGNRFTLEATLHRPGGYQMEVFAWWPGSGWQAPLTSYTGAIEVLPERIPDGLTAEQYERYRRTWQAAPTDTGGSRPAGNPEASRDGTAPDTDVFTDHPIVPGATPVRAIHFTELRSRIDALRAGVGLERFAWPALDLSTGTTPVRLVHLLELRTALEAAYAAAELPAPSWTDAAPVAGSTSLQAAHLMELRAAVAALALAAGRRSGGNGHPVSCGRTSCGAGSWHRFSRSRSDSDRRDTPGSARAWDRRHP